MNHLLLSASNYYSVVERIPVIIPTYTPNDFGTFGVRTDLNLIRAIEAWDITTGNLNVKIAIVECCNGFDILHEDLQDQIVYIEPGIDINSTAFHGNAVAGCASASTDNGIGISGIGFNCKLMLYTGSYNEILDAAQRGAKIINCSWGSIGAAPSTTINTVIETVYNMGVTVVAGAGNGICWERKFCPPGNPNDCDPCTTPTPCDGGFAGDGTCKVYPASYDHVISVTSVGHISEIGYVDPIYGANNWKDVVEEIPGNILTVHNYNDRVDISAPGYNVSTTKLNNNYGGAWGTSFASPIIAGVCGLIVSANPCLQPNGVEDILKSTAVNIDNIPENAPYAGLLGAGRVDAYEAVKAAQATYSATLDLYTKDSYNDFGVEPNVTTQYPWLSEDIWVRNQADGLTNQTHQNPEHSSTNDPNQLNYVYVRVRNKSCVATDGSETLDLHWAKASTSLNYPNNWNGTLDLIDGNLSTLPNALAGNLISSQTIPVIPAGGEVILEFTWNPPSPSDYSFNTEPGHFCLLSQIISTTDPITPYTAIGSYVTENNNVAWKNLTVVDNIAGIITDGDCPQDMMQNIGVAVAVANPDNIQNTFDIKFSVPQEELSNPITTEGKVTIALDEQLYEKWKQGGKKGIGFTEIKSPPMSVNGANNNNINGNSPITVSNRQLFEITGTSSSFDNITLAPNEIRSTSLMVTYPSNPVSEKKIFNYDIVQKRSENGELIGGVRYNIQKPDCSNLVIDAGNNQTIKRGCSVALVASSSSTLQLALGKDCSSYQWFDDSGNLISEESVVKITPNKTTTYTVKFTSSSGCVSQDQVTITVLNQLCKKEKEIIKISPNPANDFITIDYKALNTNNAHIRLLKTDNSIDRTYPLDLQNTQKTINVADCNFGSYALILVCDGINEDSEIVIIQ
jgi:hypothetical protein